MLKIKADKMQDLEKFKLEYHREQRTFATEQEAQEKLKEIQGNE